MGFGDRIEFEWCEPSEEALAAVHRYRRLEGKLDRPPKSDELAADRATIPAPADHLTAAIDSE